MHVRRRFNPKRRLAPPGAVQDGSDLAEHVRYGGNPEHKRDPGDFGLTPPASARRHKSLCDDTGILTRAAATELLRKGLRRGAVSLQRDGGYPKNVWAVTEDGHPVVAQLENRDQGIYHGYPMPENDPFRKAVEEFWATHE